MKQEKAMVWLGPETTDRGGASVAADGIIATTPIATPDGWRLAGSLLPGALVVTFDAGIQPVMQAQVLPFYNVPSAFWPLLVPPWALDNREDVLLLPEQKVLLEADLAEDLYGDPFALVPAQALEGWRGIARCRPPEPSAAVQLGFATPQILYASRGVLLSCPGDPMTDTDGPEPAFCSYSLAQARHLVACLMAEETGAALREARPHLPGFIA
jgi:hypothetical protein